MKIKTKKYDVFFVDDDEGIRKLISEELQSLGCNVQAFGNAADCVEELEKANCDLLITDREEENPIRYSREGKVVDIDEFKRKTE